MSIGGTIRFAFKMLINFILVFQKPENIPPFCYEKEPQTFVFLLCASVPVHKVNEQRSSKPYDFNS